jgi:hypothetical protein
MVRKYVEWGNCLLGLTHGNEEKHGDLRHIMSEEAREAWARTVFREWHLGHLHHKKETHFQPLSEINGVMVRILSSLSATDAWHYLKGYLPLRAAQAFLWDKQDGMIAQFNHTPKTLAI